MLPRYTDGRYWDAGRARTLTSRLFRPFPLDFHMGWKSTGERDWKDFQKMEKGESLGTPEWVRKIREV